MQALQQVVGDSILNRQLQQQIGREGFSVNQLDVSFSRQGVFSSESGAFSVDISEMTEVGKPTNETSKQLSVWLWGTLLLCSMLHRSASCLAATRKALHAILS